MMELPTFSRRKLLGGFALSGIASSLVSTAHAQKKDIPPKIRLEKGMTILFQGDSITDAGRQNRESPKPNDQISMGNGYANMATSALLASRPNLNLTIFNRGISGNKVHQLDARWQRDCLDHKPDILSILIGVNDIWHGFQGKYDGTVQRYEDDYMALLEKTKKALPNVQLVICEPFVLKCGAVKENWFPEFDRYRASARKVSDRFSTAFVPFQEMFDEAIKYAPPQYWAGDGVHPTPNGSALMADFWLQTVRG
jgi:lysophospholipase L1-like esterase